MTDDLDRLHALRVESLSIHCVKARPGERPGQIFHMDAARRPEIEDLPRVVTGELKRPTLFQADWAYGVLDDDVEVMVRMEVTSPVRCTFAAVVSVQRHSEALQHVVDEEMIALATTCGDRDGIPLLGLMLGAQAKAMIEGVLAQWRSR